ncbi:MAG: ATP-binding protein, partial [Anaerovoracaceae bacterium]
MRKRIFISMSLVAILTVVLTVTALSLIMYQQLTEDMDRELSNQALYLQTGVSEKGVDYLTQIKGADRESRITLIDSAGEVLFDNRAEAETMENHGNRPEVEEAIASGRGHDVRLSETVGSYTYYFALRLDDGNILRVASTTDSIPAALASSAPTMLGIIFVILCIAVIFARYLTRLIVRPINEIDLENPIDNEVYDELAPLLIRIHHQNDSIENQIKELQYKKREFEEITGKLAEGLVVMDDMGNILSVNESALRFLGREAGQQEFESQRGREGTHLSVLNRSLSLQRMVNTALTGGATEELFAEGERQYQIRATPTIEEGKAKGAILLILDVTEQQKAEQIRREFTANVSHELKTPLTAISGYAELMKNGMVEQEDIGAFAGKIYNESAGLITLVEDIIRLSQLDEQNVPFAMTEVDMTSLVHKVKEKLAPLAALKNIKVEVQGGGETVMGVETLLEELITNLCDNAIKYNRENGRVSIRISEESEGTLLSVEDTGIGIPGEHHDRIFERFYRVDKSHSKQTGGTGLGLSIV